MQLSTTLVLKIDPNSALMKINNVNKQIYKHCHTGVDNEENEHDVCVYISQL